MTVKCMFGSAVQEKGEAKIPEWCCALDRCADIRSSDECYYMLLRNGIDPVTGQEKEEQS